MSILEHIGALTPANRTAAVVTGSSSADVREDKRSEQHRNLALIANRLRAAIMTTTDPAIKKKYQAQIHRVNLAIAAINKSKKYPGISPFFVDAARELLPKALFATLMEDARRRYDEQQKSDAA